ncbi:MAG: type II-A CRISPR-associated protein Csn2 [Defluviitaleaceae bacterium]|nr:type II-A CRISPR-associated protein Csn2 [Defluviitaleaceae bacterium]
MNINFNMLEEPIALASLTSIVIENRVVFAKVIQGIYQYTEETTDIKLFDNKYNQLKADELMIITDILGYDVNSASVLKLIYKDLEQQISENPEIKTEIENLLGQVTGIINKEILHFEIDLESDEITLQEAFKALGIQVEIKSDSIFERTLEIIQVFKYLTKRKILIFVNLGTYLSYEELVSLYEYVRLQNIIMVLFDNAQFEVPKTAKQVVIDDDFVVLETGLKD